MSPFSARSISALALLLAACNTEWRIDPNGYRCEVGNLCPEGYACVDGVCRAGSGIDPSCFNVSCNTPPASTCTSSTTVRTYAGRCVAGQCQYEPLDTTCATTCEQGVCKDPCSGMACVTPPLAACTSPTTLRTFAQTGTCTMGRCDYPSTDTPCPNACVSGRCEGADLCQGVVCNMPPMDVCVGAARRTFSSMGTCVPATGACVYVSTDTTCPNGCALGQCLTANLAFTQSGPRLRFAVNGIDVAPGSSGNSALAVGNGKLARWDGSMWTELAGVPAGVNLNRVAFVSNSVAFAVGQRRTVLMVRPALSQVLSVSLSGSGSANLIAVSGRGENEILIADDSGNWWRRSGGWTNGSLPSRDAPYTIVGAHLDESLRERLVGSCGNPSTQCVGYRFTSGATPIFVTHQQAATPGFTAVGGGFDVPVTTRSEAFLGRADNGVDSHTNLGVFFGVDPAPALAGQGIVGITAQAVNFDRDVFVLTSSKRPSSTTPGRGGLYRLVDGPQVTSTKVLDTYFGEEALSPNEASGVLVAEVRRSDGVNNVFRRGVITNEALDVGEDFAGASINDTGALVLASISGDVVNRRPASATFDFYRRPGDWSIKGLEARNGTGVILVGQDVGAMPAGIIVRVTSGGVFSVIARHGTTVFRAACRVSDTEGWAVGTGGAIFSVSASGATAVSSPTTKDLLALDCAPGMALAVGADGAVVRLANGTWTMVAPPPVAAALLRSVRLSSTAAFVAGDGLFFSLAPGGVWTMLPSKPGMPSLIVRGPQEVYGAFATGASSEIFRFDGAAWGNSLLRVSGTLGGGVQAGGRVVWGGTLGAIVEGR